MSASMAAPRRLANAFQEFLTAVVRLRANHQSVTDAVAFRTQITTLLTRAEQDATNLGFSADDTRLAVFAVVSLLDESVLNVRSSALAEWARRPLQDELFGAHMGGEWVFQHIEQLLSRPDSDQLGDLLELHQLCLLLGFHGKYGAMDNGQLHAITSRVGDRIARLRGPAGDLAPAWAPPADLIVSRDPWLRRLTAAALGSLVLLVALWGAYVFSLRSSADDIRSLAPPSLLAPASLAR